MMATKKKATKKSAVKKSAAKKSAPKKKAGSARTTAKKKTRKAVDTITVGITPPWMAPDTMASDVYQLIANKATRPTTEELATFPWFRQDEAYQIGYYLLTHGLREHANHPEIEICNVPGVFVGAAQGLLNWIADYVLEGGKLDHGESMQMEGKMFSVIGFQQIEPETSGTVHDAPVLRVLFLA
jgi:hypothetical protein